MSEEFLCGDCKFFDLEDDAYPCVCCKRAHLYSEPGFDKLGIMFKPKMIYDEPNELNEESTEVDDVVNHPNHYCRDEAMESIEEMELVFGREAVMNFCLLNVWKYRYRAADKNGAEDLAKSDWYMRKYKKLKEKE